ncbi:MAG TPA: hydroxymethylglutaryl-CoA lyase [Myxococcales bacterium]|nr:hydroxymethylglutaryl-CoA lyase [Myxococcales bacterium]
MLEGLPARVSVYEVGPRDGLQNEAATLSVDARLELIGALADAGEKRIEAGSFVSPKWIPQLAASDEVIRRLPRREGVSYSALVPNRQGLDRALASGIREVAVFLSASETHSRKNIAKSIDEAVRTYAELVPDAVKAGLTVRGYVSVVWGCPYEGDVPVARVLEVSQALLGMGCYEISLGDTIGVGTPRQTERILGALLAKIPASRLAVHLHDTRGTALANALAALGCGIATIDASVGGLGGCPYAPGASGNLATEDLVYMLQGMGLETGIDLDRLVAAGELAQKLVGRKLPGKVLQAAIGARERAARKKE